MSFGQEERKPQGLQYCPGTLKIWVSVFTLIPGVSVQGNRMEMDPKGELFLPLFL